MDSNFDLQCKDIVQEVHPCSVFQKWDECTKIVVNPDSKKYNISEYKAILKSNTYVTVYSVLMLTVCACY